MQSEETDTKPGAGALPITRGEAHLIVRLTDTHVAMRRAMVALAMKGSHGMTSFEELRSLTKRALEAGYVDEKGERFAMRAMPEGETAFISATRLLAENDAIEACAMRLLELRASCACANCVARRAAEAKTDGWVPPAETPLVGVKHEAKP